jgi:phosphoglycolate phosphatase-like HAD superfamily hydrolase
LLAACTTTPQPAAPVLPSWSDSDARTKIVAFVESVTTPGDTFVPEAQRIAVFDNDGTLWSEQPLYFQLQFLFDQVRAQANEHPEWHTIEPFAAVLEGDLPRALAGGSASLVQLVAATQSGVDSDVFEARVENWIASARHPTTGKPYTSMVFQPMLEMLDYLRANGFETWIVSGGGLDFMRPWADEVYGIPPEQVVGTTSASQYKLVNGKPAIVLGDQITHVNDGPGKPVGIDRQIGRRPVIAFGNSDGDFEMLEWTTSGSGQRLGVYIHHTDATREWAYDRNSSIGKLERGLDEAPARGWVVVDMAADWSTIYPP